MVVIGGYNSSNTCNLARICADRVPTYHIADTDCLVVAAGHPVPAGRGFRRRYPRPVGSRKGGRCQSA